MFDTVKEVFLTTAMHLATELLLPIIALAIVMRLFYTALFGGSRRD